MFTKIIQDLELRIATLEKEAKGTKIDITIPGEYGEDYESISLKKFVKLAKGGKYEFKDYGEGIIITTGDYVEWEKNVDWDYPDDIDWDSFGGISRFEVSLVSLCEAFLISLGAKE